MRNKEFNRADLKNVRRDLVLMITGFAVIIVAVITIVSDLAFIKTDDILKNKVISMTSSLNVQMKLNLDSYLSRMETIGTLAFGDENAYTYDATDPDNDEYEAINTEKKITEKLNSLCIMDNFVDYGIVYRNGRNVGKISNGTTKLFGDKLYDELSAMITRHRTNDGWKAGYNNDFKRIYYVKRVHENALLVLSFYTRELEDVFDNPQTLADMDIRLVNANYNILYSARRDETGEPLPEDILSRVKGNSSADVLDDSYLVSVNSCGDDWYVICSVPTAIILNEKNEMRIYIIAVGVIAAIIAVVLGCLLSVKFTSPVRWAVEFLDEKARTDLLTGVMNKQSFNEKTEMLLKEAENSSQHAFILLDLDDFKGINDNLGHTFGDEVLINTGKILREQFGENDILGRVGGDEFCVFVNSAPADGEDYEGFIRKKCEALCASFGNNYTGEDKSYKVSASIGVSFFPQDGTGFRELYTAADKALYSSKKSGKDTFAFYDAKSGKEA